MKLIEHWRTIVPRRWSTWLAGANALLAAYVFSQPVLVIGLLGFAPGTWLIPLAIIAAVLGFGLPVVVAALEQPKLKAKIEEKNDADPA